MLDSKELRDAVERDIGSLLPGGRLLDAELRVEESLPIDFVLADSDGRLVLVMLILGGAEASVFTALDAVAFVRRHGESLIRNLFRDEVDASLRPRVVLLAEHFAERALHRLAPLLDSVSGDLSLHELRRVESRAGERLYFVPVAERRGVQEIGDPSSLDQFLASLPESSRPFGRELIARISRVDEELESTVTGQRVLWSLRGQPACALEYRADRGYFVLQVPGADRALVDDELSLQGALDRVMARSVELFDQPLPAESEPSAELAAERAAPAEELFAVEGLEPEAPLDDLSDLDLTEPARAVGASGTEHDPDLGPLPPLEEALGRSGALGALAAAGAAAFGPESELEEEEPATEGGSPSGAATEGPRPQDALDGADLDEDDLEELDDSEPESERHIPPTEGELLTPEEIEAFRDF